jgi:hypothetical protein
MAVVAWVAGWSHRMAEQRRRRTLKHRLGLAVLTPVTFTGAAFLTLSVLNPAAPVTLDRIDVEGPSSQELAVARLSEEHRCWSGPAPADMVGRIPSHAIVTKPSGETVYAGPRLTGIALEQAINGKNAGLEVWAFCEDLRTRS